MASAAQIQANRLNAQSSTGPRTPEGKLRSSANSLKTGYCARTLYVPESMREEYEAYRRDLVTDTRPEGAIEYEYFNRLLLHGWNLYRIRITESQLVLDATEAGKNPVADPDLRLLARYRRELEHSYDRAVKALRELQTQRAALLQQNPEAIATVASITPLAAVTSLTDITDPFLRACDNVRRDSDFTPNRAAAIRRVLDVWASQEFLKKCEVPKSAEAIGQEVR
jgi:hypothetical protein